MVKYKKTAEHINAPLFAVLLYLISELIFQYFVITIINPGLCLSDMPLQLLHKLRCHFFQLR